MEKQNIRSGDSSFLKLNETVQHVLEERRENIFFLEKNTHTHTKNILDVSFLI